MQIEKVIFDLGKVLVKFDPKNLFNKLFNNNDEISYFYKNVCTWEWHVNQDLVYDTDEATKQKIKEYPEFKEAIEAFYGRFQEMIIGTYDSNIEILKNLKNKGMPIYVLSNFPGKQFDIYMSKNEFLNLFDDMIISGKVGLKKPDPMIYNLAIKKFNCIPEKTLFIDDRPENTESAKRLGFNVITLDNPDKLKDYIKEFNL